jgi:hypothetical protein
VISPVTNAHVPAPTSRVESATAAESSSEGGLKFGDLLDIINPLHHIPIVGDIYRKLTGDDIKPAFQIAGGALFGGPLGAVLAAVNVGARGLFNALREDVAPEPRVMRTALSQQAPGGWMVASTRDFDQAAPPNLSLAVQTNSEPEQQTLATLPTRRGGWMVNAAYAMADARAALVTSTVHIDTAV